MPTKPDDVLPHPTSFDSTERLAQIKGYVLNERRTPARKLPVVTPHQTIGPFYPHHLVRPGDEDLAAREVGGPRAEGEPMEIVGTITDLSGKPVAGDDDGDTGRIEGPVVLRLGHPDESYAGIRKDQVHVAGRLVLADALGPFGNPTSDSARTMVTVETTQAIVVIFAPVALDTSVAEGALAMTRERVQTFCGFQS